MKLSSIVALGLSSAVLTFAQAPATTTAAAPVKTEKTAAKPAAALKITGTLESVDVIGNMLCVKVGKIIDTISVDATTKIKLDAKESTLGDLQSGKSVAVAYKTEAGKKVAVTIMQKTVKAAAKAGAAPAAEKPATEPAAK